MRRIVKKGEPKELIDYKLSNKDVKKNLDYRYLGAKERGPLKETLIMEQGYLCAYTMKRISMDTCHIEHIKPEGLCREQANRGLQTVSDLDYLNMVACFPKEGMSSKIRYGAQFKDNWWDDDGRNFISPLASNCEDQFSFDIKGNISGTTVSARTTIDVLKLDHGSLTEDRKRAIDTFLYGENQKPISKAKAQSALIEIMQLQSGMYPQFCLTIKWALQEHISRIDKLALKAKHIKSAKNKK
ncbi:uncharacterized protein (TIGR02646 family) [Flavobacterium sp. 9]|uniref:retron system putative HNH endonuclease n=1 Tax=Flavobacterium sp. 9 TaxID=2035198 RepID=UPI000C19F8D2|nr:retron system putative HNH endonuclease [Flavobacterium sp. 9]PIF34541.1 uncharacterized protein (TIGR02646 family) [Flavobacterium sp. 9]